MITTCTTCGQNYEAGSEEQANEQERLCPLCAFNQEKDSAGMCENCMTPYFRSQGTRGGRNGKKGFCSDDCREEFEQDEAAFDKEYFREVMSGEYGPPDSDPHDIERPEY